MKLLSYQIFRRNYKILIGVQIFIILIILFLTNLVGVRMFVLLTTTEMSTTKTGEKKIATAEKMKTATTTTTAPNSIINNYQNQNYEIFNRDPRYERQVPVKTSEEFLQALEKAEPGDVISLEDGLYSGVFIIMRGGSAEREIILEGSKDAVIENPTRVESDYEIGFGLHLKASHWILRGFTVRNSLKGIIIDGGNSNVILNVTLTDMDDEAIHMRYSSNNNLVMGCFINDTGKVRLGYGEGVYVGVNSGRWVNGTPDRCDGNHIIGNTFGRAVRGECIDIKEGTCCGRVAHNRFDGHGLTNSHSDDSWVDIKGDMYVIEDNVGNFSNKDGFAIRNLLPNKNLMGGCGNIFQRNRCEFQPDNFNGYCVAFYNRGKCFNLVKTDNMVFNGMKMTNF